MALKGTLKDFGIENIFQLIQQQQKAGVLRMTDKGTEVRILFDAGKIVGAESTGAKQQKEPLGVLLVRAGLVKPERLEAALATQQKTLRKLGDILIQDGAISRDDLKSFLVLQTREVINRLFRWRSGEYEFIPQAVKYDADVATPLNPEHLLMDGFRMIDEWPAVQKKIGGLETIPGVAKGVEGLVVRKARGAPGGDDEDEEDGDDGDEVDDAFAAFEEGGPKPDKKAKEKRIKLTASQTVVFDLIDGKHTVQDIVDRSLLGEFNTCNALAGLMDKGAAVVVGRKKIEEAGRIHVVERRRGKTLQLLGGLVVSLAVIAVSGAAILVLFVGAGAAISTRAVKASSGGTLDESLSVHRANRAARAAEVFFLRHGRWPKDLGETVADGLLAADELVDAAGRPLELPPRNGAATAALSPP